MFKKDITAKQFLNAMISFTLIEFANSLTCMIDGMVTARFLGPNAIAGVGIAGIYFSICAVISFTLAAAGQSLCTYYLGKGDYEKSNRIYSTIFAIGMAAGLLLTILGVLFAGPFAQLLGARGENAILLDYAKSYLIGVFLGSVPNIMVAALCPLLTLAGKTKLVNVSSAAVIIVDVVLDLLNVYVFNQGTLGMGLATSLSYVAALIVIMAGLTQKDSLFTLSGRLIKLSEVAPIIRTGFPRGISMIARAIGPVLINLFVLSIASTAGLVALSVRGSVMFLCQAIPWGIGSAVLLVAGCFYGETDRAGMVRIYEIAINYIIGLVLPLSLLLIVFAPLIAQIYISTSDPAYAMTVKFLRLYFASLPISGMNLIGGSVLQVVGKSKGTYIFNIANEFVGLFATIWVMGTVFGIDGVWWAYLVWQFILQAFYIVIALVRKTEHQDARTKLLYLEDDFCLRSSNVFSANVQSYEEVAYESAQIQKFCNDHRLPDNTGFKVALCMSELADNIIKHGFREGKTNLCELRIAINDKEVILHLRDNCPQFNFSEYVKTCSYDPARPDEKIGIHMVVNMATDIRYANTLNVNNLFVKI